MCGILYEGKAEKERQGPNDAKEIARCTQKALDFYRASVVKYPRLRASYAGLLRVCEDSKEQIQAATALLQIKESTFFDDSPKFYTKKYEDWTRGMIEFSEKSKVKEALDVCD
jgi:hypothetical protein